MTHFQYDGNVNDRTRSHRPRVALRTNVRSLRSRSGLIRFARDVTSQNGEDGIVAEIFRRLGKRKGKRYAVDVGAWDGKHLSNTYSLLVNNNNNEIEEEQRWHGILIEADPKRYEELRASHEPLGHVCLRRCVSCVPGSPSSLRSILEKTSLPESFDFISIDVDGTDYWLMCDLLTRYKPRVICVEFNPTIPNEIVYVQPRSDSIRHGSSLAALVELASSKGYTLIETTLYNAFFVPTSLYEAHFHDLVPDTSIEALHETTMGTKLYQLYDGSLKLAGCKKLLWHRKRIEERDIQVLRPEERSFPFRPSTSVATIGEVNVDAIDVNDDQASEKLWSALSADGFVFVKGTQISKLLCRSALDMARAYFEASENVRRSSFAKDRARRGYSPMMTENFASLVGESAPNDCVRKFRIGREAQRDGDEETAATKTTTTAATSALHQANAWPDPSLWEHGERFRDVVSKYYEAMRVVGVRVLGLIAKGMERHGFERNASQIIKCGRCRASSSDILTLLGYQRKRRQPRKNKPIRPFVAKHTDVGVITMLLYEPSGDCAKLQRESAKNEWIDVSLPPLGDDPVFCLNIGDALSDMTDGELKSTLHRVVPTPNGRRSRQSLAMFVGLDPDAEMRVSGETMTYEAWRRRRVRGL